MAYKEKLLKILTEIFPSECSIVQEHRFMHSRNWRFDYAIPLLKIAIEYQGGTFRKQKSSHTSVAGQTRDWEKFNEAQIRGWIVLCVNPITIDNGTFIKQFKRAIRVKNGEILYE